MTWLRVLGPPKVLITDEESGRYGSEAAVWAER